MPSRFAHTPSSSSLCMFAQRNVTWRKKCQKTNWSDLVQHNGRHNLPPPRPWWERRTRDGVKRDRGRRRRSNRGMAVHLLGGHVAVEGCGHRSDHTHSRRQKQKTHMYTRAVSKAAPGCSCSYCCAAVGFELQGITTVRQYKSADLSTDSYWILGFHNGG